MIQLAITFIAEFIVAFVCYLALRKFLPANRLAILVLVAGLVGLPAGWVAGYRMTAGKILNQYYASVNNDYRGKTGQDIPMNEWLLAAEQLQSHPDYYPSLHKGAAVHAIPALLLVFALLGTLAKRREKKQRPKV